MLNDELRRVRAQAAKTGHKHGGIMPHTPDPNKLTDAELAYGLQRVSGWQMTPEAVRALRDA